jgi:hypothetical protein
MKTLEKLINPKNIRLKSNMLIRINNVTPCVLNLKIRTTAMTEKTSIPTKFKNTPI